MLKWRFNAAILFWDIFFLPFLPDSAQIPQAVKTDQINMQTLELTAVQRHATGTANFEADPDVIVLQANHTTIFKIRNARAAEWLREYYRLSADGATEIRVHPVRCGAMVTELTAAGFAVAVS
jgi:hypothetical protein